MATFSTTADVGEVVVVSPGQTVTATLTVADSSTFDGTINFELATDPLFGQGYVVLEANTTASGSDTITYVHDEKPGYEGKPVYVRLRAGVIGTESDPITGVLAASCLAPEVCLDGSTIEDQNGNTVLTLSTTGLTGPLSGAISGIVFADDPAAADFSETEVSVQDGTWTELDLSGSVGSVQALCLLNIVASDDTQASSLLLRPAGDSNSLTTTTVAVASSVEKIAQVIVCTNSSGLLEYNVPSGTMTVTGTVIAYVTVA